MRKWRGIGLAVLVLSAGSLAAATGQTGSKKSGPEAGEFVSPFDVYDVTGPNKGTELCYR
jgi:hypothetical protein